MAQKNKSKKRLVDINELAASVLEEAIGSKPEVPADNGKNPAAVELGRLGGKKGGKARAEKLSPEERTEIARMAARARWHKKDNSE
jgi:hypothetical protein